MGLAQFFCLNLILIVSKSDFQLVNESRDKSKRASCDSGVAAELNCLRNNSEKTRPVLCDSVDNGAKIQCCAFGGQKKVYLRNNLYLPKM